MEGKRMKDKGKEREGKEREEGKQRKEERDDGCIN